MDENIQLYGWLTERYPRWEDSIGKVVDEKCVLFNTSLSPRLTDGPKTLYGVEIDLNEINKTVKTVGDYEKEKAEAMDNILNITKLLSDTGLQVEKDKENLKRKYQSKIRERKGAIQENEYLISVNENKRQLISVKLSDLSEKADLEKQIAIDVIDKAIQQATDLELTCEQEIHSVEKELNSMITTKESEATKRIDTESTRINTLLRKLDDDLKSEMAEYQKKKSNVNAQKSNELRKKGANTIRLSQIDERVSEIKKELAFIEEHRDIVSEYKKDKRELIDNVEIFKHEKKTLQRRLKAEEDNYRDQHEKLNTALQEVQDTIKACNQILTEIEEDNAAFEIFQGSECFNTISQYLSTDDHTYKPEGRPKLLIDHIKEIHYDKINSSLDEIRKTITDFLGKFSDDNIFKFKKNLTDNKSFLAFAECSPISWRRIKLKELKKKLTNVLL